MSFGVFWGCCYVVSRVFLCRFEKAMVKALRTNKFELGKVSSLRGGVGKVVSSL
jgi:hypothetical protein